MEEAEEIVNDQKKSDEIIGETHDEIKSAVSSEEEENKDIQQDIISTATEEKAYNRMVQEKVDGLVKEKDLLKSIEDKVSRESEEDNQKVPKMDLEKTAINTEKNNTIFTPNHSRIGDEQSEKLTIKKSKYIKKSEEKQFVPKPIKPIISIKPLRDTELPLKENGSGKDMENKQNVKRNIKQIIQKYKRTRSFNEELRQVPKGEIHTKDTIKRIIETERVKQERDEINKIQQQIMEIIESNPRITNKELIKTKLRDTIINELYNAIDLKIQESDIKIKGSGESQLDQHVDRSAEIEKMFKAGDDDEGDTETKQAKEIPRKVNEIPYKSTGKRLNNTKDSKPKINIVRKEKIPKYKDMEELTKSDENHETGEIDIPKEIIHPKNAPAKENYENKRSEEKSSDDKLAFVKKFKKANEKIDDIMLIIDEIVDTIEITDEDDDEMFY